MTGALFKLHGAGLKGVNIKTIALQTFVHSPIVVGFLEIGFSIRKRLKKTLVALSYFFKNCPLFLFW